MTSRVSTPRVPEPGAAVPDPLGETLHLLRLTGAFYCRAELSAPWAIAMPPLEGSMMFHIVTAGHGWLELPGAAPRLLQPGSLTLVSHGMGHTIRSIDPGPVTRLFDIPVEQVSDRYEVMRHGGGGAATQAMCGVVRFEHVLAQRLVEQLPPVLQVDSWSDADASWLQSTLRFIASEAGNLRPGGETVITRLADILVIQALRNWLDSGASADVRWLVALRDPQIGAALAALHRTPEKPWSVGALANSVAMSRSAFSARFSALTGESAMHYLTQWRLALAHARLRESGDTMGQIANRFGYRSEAAFCRAFKRAYGISPGRVRRADHDGWFEAQRATHLS